MNQTRVAQGVPAGGQFSTHSRQEAQSSLEGTGTVEDQFARIAEAALRDSVLTRFPQAATVNVAPHEDGWALVSVEDAGGSRLWMRWDSNAASVSEKRWLNQLAPITAALREGVTPFEHDGDVDFTSRIRLRSH